MEFIHQIISEQMIHALGWTVLHSLWQAAAVALVLTLVLRGLQKQTADVRYRVAYAALLVTFGLAVMTFFSYYNENRCNDFSENDIVSEVISPYGYVYTYEKDGQFYTVHSNEITEALSRITFYFNDNLSSIVLLWLLGMTFFAARLLGGLAYVEYLKTAYTSSPPAKWQAMLDDLASQIPVKQTVALLESALIKVPVVIGHFKPVILLPLGAVNALTPAQVEAILAHELAHVARYDYLLHILQSVIEVFFYFNPAVWWIGSHVRIEREHCCDDTAVALCGNELAYAKALVALQEMSVATPNLAMTFSKNKNQLLRRVQRILHQPQNKWDIMEKLTATCLLLAVLVGLSVSAAEPYNDWMESADHFMESDMDFDMEPVIEFEFDTIPNGNRNGTFSYDDGKRQIEAKIENNKITRLEIDGREIPESEIVNYQEMVEELMADVPEPPTPMEPMDAMPPMPAIPPTPNIWNHHDNGKVIKQKDKDGNTIITIGQGNDESVTLQITKDGKTLLNGKELKDGEEAAIFNNYFNEDMKGFDEEAWQKQWEAQEEAFRKQEEDLRKQEERWRENEERRREEYDKRMEQHRENLDRRREELENRQEALEERNRDIVERNEALAERNAALAETDREKPGRGLHFFSKVEDDRNTHTYVREAVASDDIRKALEKELLKDNIIKTVKDYNLEITNKMVKVNDKELPEALTKKYIQLYEKEGNFKMKSSSSYRIGRKEK